MIIKTLPELVIMLEKYKNPYIIRKYKGIDWMNYVQYNDKNIKCIDLNINLSLVSLQDTNTPYKIYNNDSIHILEGEILLDEYKRIHTNFFNQDIYVTKDCVRDTRSDYFRDTRSDYFRDTCKDDIITLCKGIKIYNSFIHYRSL